MSDFVLPVAMRLPSVYFADDASILATLNRVDPIVVRDGHRFLRHDPFWDSEIHATLGAVSTVLMTTWTRALQSIHGTAGTMGRTSVEQFALGESSLPMFGDHRNDDR